MGFKYQVGKCCGCGTSEFHEDVPPQCNSSCVPYIADGFIKDYIRNTWPCEFVVFYHKYRITNNTYSLNTCYEKGFLGKVSTSSTSYSDNFVYEVNMNCNYSYVAKNTLISSIEEDLLPMSDGYRTTTTVYTTAFINFKAEPYYFRFANSSPCGYECVSRQKKDRNGNYNNTFENSATWKNLDDLESTLQANAKSPIVSIPCVRYAPGDDKHFPTLPIIREQNRGKHNYFNPISIAYHLKQTAPLNDEGYRDYFNSAWNGAGLTFVIDSIKASQTSKTFGQDSVVVITDLSTILAGACTFPHADLSIIVPKEYQNIVISYDSGDVPIKNNHSFPAMPFQFFTKTTYPVLRGVNAEGIINWNPSGWDDSWQEKFIGQTGEITGESNVLVNIETNIYDKDLANVLKLEATKFSYVLNQGLTVDYSVSLKKNTFNQSGRFKIDKTRSTITYAISIPQQTKSFIVGEPFDRTYEEQLAQTKPGAQRPTLTYQIQAAEVSFEEPFDLAKGTSTTHKIPIKVQIDFQDAVISPTYDIVNGDGIYHRYSPNNNTHLYTKMTFLTYFGQPYPMGTAIETYALISIHDKIKEEARKLINRQLTQRYQDPEGNKGEADFNLRIHADVNQTLYYIPSQYYYRLNQRNQPYEVRYGE